MASARVFVLVIVRECEVLSGWIFEADYFLLIALNAGHPLKLTVCSLVQRAYLCETVSVLGELVWSVVITTLYAFRSMLAIVSRVSVWLAIVKLWWITVFLMQFLNRDFCIEKRLDFKDVFVIGSLVLQYSSKNKGKGHLF